MIVLNEDKDRAHIVRLAGVRVATCAYGENPHQRSYGLYRLGIQGEVDDSLGVDAFERVEGGMLSHNNFTDLSKGLDVIARIAAVFALNELPVGKIAVGIKHGTVCGASSDSVNEKLALRDMVSGDPLALFGGVVVANFEFDAEHAEILISADTKVPRILDLVAVPSITESAKKILSRKNQKCRIVLNNALAQLGFNSMEKGIQVVQVRGGVLVQEFPQYVPLLTSDQLLFNGDWPSLHLSNMLLAWAVGSASLSNTITLVRDGLVVGNGIGQTSRVSSCRLAVFQAGDRARGALAYSDSFFPFPDGIDVLADTGVSHIFTASGSIRDVEIKQRMEDRDISYCLVPDKIGRSFRH